MPYKNPHPLYSTWAHIKSRAKRGPLPFEKAWDSFESFLLCVGMPPEPGMQLLRKSPARGYTAENVVWGFPSDKFVIREQYRPSVSHSLYSVWRSMLARCHNRNSAAYPAYGGRGIRVCERWQNSFFAFIDDMGERPPGTSIDRINNDGDYEPSNCRWANKRQQQRNQRITRKVVLDGKEYLACELAARLGVKTDTICARVERGASTLEAVAKLNNGSAAMAAKKRAATHCKHGHEFTPLNTSITPQGWRRCRACHNAKMRRRNAMAREARYTSSPETKKAPEGL